MNWFELFFYTFIIVFPFILGLAVIAGASFASRWPKFFVYPYLAILVFFTGSEYGLLEQSASHTIYSRGGGQLYFPFVNLYLFGLALVVCIQSLWQKIEPPTARLTRYLLAFNVIFIGNVLVGLVFAERSIFDLLHQRGAFYVVNTVILVFVVLRAFRSSRDIEELATLLMYAVAARGAFGIFRFAFLGGDPANYYANFEMIAVRLTFFDINDSILATIGALIAFSRLLERPAGKPVHGCILMLEVAIVLLSFRRTAWLGLLGALLVAVWIYRKRVRFAKLMPSLSVAVVALFSLWVYRFQQGAGHGEVLATLFPDLTSKTGELTAKTGRFFELGLAFETILDNPIFGVGVWGEYAYSANPLIAFHRGRFDFMHSGFLHIWLKMGLIGMLAFAGAVWVTARDGWRAIPAATPVGRSLMIAGVGGVVAFMPTLLFGTPIIEYRTMQVLAVVLALPYLGLVHSKTENGQKPNAPTTAA